MNIEANEKIQLGLQFLEGFLEVKPSRKFRQIKAFFGDKNIATQKDGSLNVEYKSLADFYGMLGRALACNDEQITFDKKISQAGVMLDCARNAVIRPCQAKKMIAVCALLGFNYFELYVEDCLEVDDEPYFGYMRGRFTQSEIKELDDFAKTFGVELVPCVQTLAHLERLFFHWREYTAKVCDKKDVLLVDEPRTYTLIENVIKTASKCFTSRKINIGMDEAFDLGLGQFLLKHGYEPSGSIIRRHLRKVIEICEKYGFYPSMWGDMFYDDLLSNKYGDIPNGVELIYWDYCIKEDRAELKERLTKMMNGAKISFAGGTIKHVGFAPFSRYSAIALDSTFDVLVECGIQTYLMTAWGDDGAEAGHFSILPNLCYFADKNCGGNVKEELCRVISGYSYTEFCMLDDLNYPVGEEYTALYNPCKHLFYADPFIGVEEIVALPEFNDFYAKLTKKLKQLSMRKCEFSYLFKTAYALSRVLELKAYMVEELYFAYKNKDKSALELCLEKLKKVLARISTFIKTYENQWRKESKELGFEIMQIRLYGLRGRITYIIKRIEEYLSGKVSIIEELEEQKYFHPLTEGEYKGKLYNQYTANVTYGKM